jgi:hypothetical protein
LASGLNAPYSIAVDTTTVYFAESNPSGRVMRCPLAGCGGSPTVLASGQNNIGAIAIDASYVYWPTVLNPGSVLRCALGGCGGAPTVLASNQYQPYSIATDGTYLYWTNLVGGGNMGTVAYCALSNCAPATMATGLNYPLYLAVDNTSTVYWTNINDGTVKTCKGGPA